MSSGPDQVHYEIVVQGHLSERWSAWFDGLTVEARPDGTTVLSGPLVDQAALHGVLQRLRDLGIGLVALNRADGSPATTTDTTDHHERNPHDHHDR